MKPWAPRCLTERKEPTAVFVDSSEEEKNESTSTMSESREIAISDDFKLINSTENGNSSLSTCVSEADFKVPFEIQLISHSAIERNDSESQDTIGGSILNSNSVCSVSSATSVISSSEEASEENLKDFSLGISSRKSSEDSDDTICGGRECIRLPSKPVRKPITLTKLQELKLNQRLLADLKNTLSFEEDVKNKQEFYWIHVTPDLSEKSRENIRLMLHSHHQMPVEWIDNHTIEICIHTETKMEKDRKPTIHLPYKPKIVSPQDTKSVSNHTKIVVPSDKKEVEHQKNAQINKPFQRTENNFSSKKQPYKPKIQPNSKNRK